MDVHPWRIAPSIVMDPTWGKVTLAGMLNDTHQQGVKNKQSIL